MGPLEAARLLTQLRQGGPEAFYRGAIANEIAHEVTAAGDFLTAADLSGYEARDTKRSSPP